MANIPQKIEERLKAGIKKFQPILAAAHDRGANEVDTVTIIKDILSEVFGYAKYSELISEKKISGTFCDIATKVDESIHYLVEAKAINQDLKDNYVRQAVDYAVKDKDGAPWVVLTNGAKWQIYKISDVRPIKWELVLEIEFANLKHTEPADLEKLFLLTKESWAKSALKDYYDQWQALSKFSITAVILGDSVLNLIRRELKRVSPDVKIDADQIRFVLEHEVLRGDVVNDTEGKYNEACKRISKAASKALRSKSDKNANDETASVEPQPPPSVAPTPPPATI